MLGLPGMLKTFGMRERTAPLVIAGPRGLDRFWRTVAPVTGRLPFEVELREVEGGDLTWDGDGYVVEAVGTDHGVPSVGWRLDEDDRPGRFDVDAARRLGVTPGEDFGVLQRGGDVTAEDGATVRPQDVLGDARIGRRIVYSGDTAACAAIRDASHEATLLVHEATFLREDEERARATRHATAADAALTAAAADVDLLVLTHVSTRYAPRDLRDEARELFARVEVARDFDLVELPYPERGEPVLVPRGGRPPRERSSVQASGAGLGPADRPAYAEQGQPDA